MHALAGGEASWNCYDIIRVAGGGEIVEELAKDAGVARNQAEQALRTLSPELGRAIRRTGESRTGAPAVRAAMQDERYARYLDQPAALREVAAAADGERVLEEVLDEEQRDELVRERCCCRADRSGTGAQAPAAGRDPRHGRHRAAAARAVPADPLVRHAAG